MTAFEIAVDAATPPQEPTAACGSLSNRSGAAAEWRVSPGLTDYPTALVTMETRVEDILAGHAAEQIWLVEHAPLYSAGTSARPEDLLDPGRFPVHRAGRGGQYTYHGPGQRVAYAMLNLTERGRDIRCFVSYLENWIITALARFGVTGERRDGRIGIWVPASEGRPEAKIASVGIRVRHWVTFHGVSINVAPDLDHFAGIIPCGAPGYGVTSLADLGIDVPMATFDAALREAFALTFGDQLTP